MVRFGYISSIIKIAKYLIHFNSLLVYADSLFDCSSEFVSFPQILLNEVAPRPHNSGHHTIESCYTSQFEQHLRAVVGLPLGDPSMKAPAAIMYNLLGEDEVILLLPSLTLFQSLGPLDGWNFASHVSVN